MLWIAALEYNANNLQKLSKIWVFSAEKSIETYLGALFGDSWCTVQPALCSVLQSEL